MLLSQKLNFGSQEASMLYSNKVRDVMTQTTNIQSLFTTLSKFNRQQNDGTLIVPENARTKETICMESQSLFSGKIRKNISKCRMLILLPSMLGVKPLLCLKANC